jgi:hypothetical protein
MTTRQVIGCYLMIVAGGVGLTVSRATPGFGDYVQGVLTGISGSVIVFGVLLLFASPTDRPPEKQNSRDG